MKNSLTVNHANGTHSKYGLMLTEDKVSSI